MSVSWEKQELAAILQPQEEFSDNPSINKNVATVNPNQEDQTVDQTDFNEFGDNTAVSIDEDEEE